MKTLIYSIAFLSLLIGTIGCSQIQVKKAENADTAKAVKTPVSQLEEKIKPDLEFESEFALFKAKVNAKLNENDRKIDQLKERRKKETKEIRLKLDQQIKEFEVENNTLKNKIKAQNVKDKKAWENFKNELNQDMDKLNESISKIFDKK